MKKEQAKILARALVKITEGKEGKVLEQRLHYFLEYLKQKRQLDGIGQIIDMLEMAWKEKYGVAKIQVESAYPLNAASKKLLEEVSHHVKIKEEVNKELIGGACVRIDDQIIDGTIAGALTKLKNSLTQTM